jgi:hypothetical protein
MEAALLATGVGVVLEWFVEGRDGNTFYGSESTS